ncbi:protein NipSnap homolog 3A [Stigmatopora argus]
MIRLLGCTRLSGRFQSRPLLPDARPTHPAADLSTRHQPEGDGALYEFRTYQIHPDRNSAFLNLTNEKIHLRTAHSELIGYWSVEYGALNQVFHIWKYESYAQRAAVRSALAQDERWINEYILHAIPMLTQQDNCVVTLLPWSRVGAPPKPGGVFELTSFRTRPGAGGTWASCLQDDEAAGRPGLLAAFLGDVGHPDTVYALRWFESADERGRTPCDGAALGPVESRRNKLMFPCPFSPLK